MEIEVTDDIRVAPESKNMIRILSEAFEKRTTIDINGKEYMVVAKSNSVFSLRRLVSVKPAEWTGEGLPPVGTVCEFDGFNPDETMPTDPRVGDQVTVIAHFKSGPIDFAAFTFFAPPDFEFLQVGQGAHGCFRPIRTPEQIAAEERTKTIDDMVKALGMDEPGTAEYIRCGLIYDAGYRKQVAP